MHQILIGYQKNYLIVQAANENDVKLRAMEAILQLMRSVQPTAPVSDPLMLIYINEHYLGLLTLLDAPRAIMAQRYF